MEQTEDGQAQSGEGWEGNGGRRGVWKFLNGSCAEEKYIQTEVCVWESNKVEWKTT